MRELFASFDGRLTFKGLRLPKFSEVRSETVEDAEIDILAITDTGVWVGEVKDRNVTQADVRRFVSKVAMVSGSFTVEYCVLICLLGIDSSAYATARREDIAIWLREDVNFLMEHGGKFPIMI